jgi:hypothetical protein
MAQGGGVEGGGPGVRGWTWVAIGLGVAFVVCALLTALLAFSEVHASRGDLRYPCGTVFEPRSVYPRDVVCEDARSDRLAELSNAGLATLGLAVSAFTVLVVSTWRRRPERAVPDPRR